MGQQQMLLLVLGTIVVGLAIAVAVVLFHDSAVNSNRDALVNDLMDFASRAQQFYHAPAKNGGGGYTFSGITLGKLTNNASNENGSYSIISAAPQELVLAGKGLYLIENDSVEVHCTVTPTAYTFEKIH